jgi:hypothetical protein
MVNYWHEEEMGASWKSVLNSDPVPWLLDGEDPAVAAQTLQSLEDRHPTDPEIRSLQTKAMLADPIKTILGAQSREGQWLGDNPNQAYRKYQGSSWNLLFLAELGAIPENPQVQKGCRNLLENNFVEGVGAFSANGRPNGVMVCFNAHMVYALTRLGFGGDPRLASAMHWLARQQSKSGGFLCRIIEYALLPDCVMTIPKVLKMAGAIPKSERTQETQTMVQRAVDYLLSLQLYRYVPARSKEWYEMTWKKPIAEIRQLKQRFEPGPLGEKKGWLRFQFPLHYNSDLLEVLWTMARLKVNRNPVIKQGIEQMLSLQTPKGAWVMKDSLNGKMWIDIEKKGQPSRWLTLRACEVLKMYID